LGLFLALWIQKIYVAIFFFKNIKLGQSPKNGLNHQSFKTTTLGEKTLACMPMHMGLVFPSVLADIDFLQNYCPMFVLAKI
jgi:hypothetical protein